GAVNWAIENGITTAENARPEDNITRGELALMIYKHMTGKHLKLDVKPSNYKDSASFKAIDGADLETVKKALDYCATAGLIMGDDAGNMRFDAATKRSEVAAVFTRMYDFASVAEVDIAASEANGEILKYDAAAINKSVTLAWAGKELLEEDGKTYVHIRPRTKKGTVEVTLGQWNLPDVDFYEYQYMKIKYRIKGGESSLDICLRTNTIQQWLASGAGTRPENTAEDEWLLGMTRYCDYIGNYEAKAINSSDKNAHYIFKPFGNDQEIAEDAYFDIESIVFFKNEFVAKAYEW
ncbi:MAG: hypothetical protein IJ391_03630, partial [Clostridia bacterium]|nr:hypothetical protein [Clostridia bacterium]